MLVGLHAIAASSAAGHALLYKRDPRAALGWIGVSLTLLSIAMEGSVGFFETVPRSTAYVYFAFVTITSLGYGDLTPYTDAGRLVTILAAVTAQMYLVIVLARLVAIWNPQRNRNDGDDE